MRPYGQLVETADGALVSLLIGAKYDPEGEFADVRTWGAVDAKGYSIRSTDGGASWSGPVDLDATAWDGTYGKFPVPWILPKRPEWPMATRSRSSSGPSTAR